MLSPSRAIAFSLRSTKSNTNLFSALGSDMQAPASDSFARWPSRQQIKARDCAARNALSRLFRVGELHDVAGAQDEFRRRLVDFRDQRLRLLAEDRIDGEARLGGVLKQGGVGRR